MPVIACVQQLLYKCRHGAPKEVIQEKINYCSIEALHYYERRDEVQHKSVSSLHSNALGNSCSIIYIHDQHLISIKNCLFIQF